MSVSTAFFDQLYADNSDPWPFASAGTNSANGP